MEKWSQARITNLTSPSEHHVAKRCLRFNTSIMKREKLSVITHISETTRDYHEAGPCTKSLQALTSVELIAGIVFVCTACLLQ